MIIPFFFQTYVKPDSEFAVNNTEPPEQKVVGVVVEIIAFGNPLTLIFLVFEHPFEST
jgi:hypothetical protein